MKNTQKILQLIKVNGATTAKMLAEQLGVTTMGARQHLQNLEDDGLLVFEDIKVKVGRPTRHWSLTPRGHAQFSDHHAELTVQVIDAVEKLFGSDGVQKVAEERERNTLLHYQRELEGYKGLESKLSKLVELRRKEGYMAELEVTDKGFVLVENHCPISKAAAHCSSLCQSELNVFRQLLGGSVAVTRSEHIIQGQRRCAYLILP